MNSPKRPETADIAPPTPGFLRQIETKSIDVVGKLLGMKDEPKEDRIVTLTREQQLQIRQIEERAVAEFTGELPQLEAALGMLRMGHYFGWKVLYLIHSKKTIRNYEAILDIKVREVFDERGPCAHRSIGLNLADRFSNFWKVVGGDIKIPHKQESA